MITGRGGGGRREAAKESKLEAWALPPPLLYLYATVKTHIKEVYGWRFIARAAATYPWAWSLIGSTARAGASCRPLTSSCARRCWLICRAAIGATGPLVDSARRPWSSAAHLRPRVEQSVGPQSIGHPEYPEYPESISLLFS